MKSFLLWGVFFLISRIPFINPGQVFFDSNEYLLRLSNPSFFQSLANGHVPLHSGYLLVFWPVWQGFDNLLNNSSMFVILLQIILSYFGVWAFYKVSSEFLPKIAAILSGILISITPLFWITNTTIMMESTYVATFFIGIWLFSCFIKTRDVYLLILGASLLFISLLTHLAPLLYLPFAVFLFWTLGKKYKTPSPHLYSLLITLFVVMVSFTFINSYLLDQGSLLNGVKTLYFGKTQEASPLELSLQGISRYARNWIIPTMRNVTSLVFIIAVVGFWISVRKRQWGIILLLSLWFLPSFIVNQWSDSLWYGRHALISYFGITLAAGLFLYSRIKITVIVIMYVLCITLPQMFLLRDTSPYISLQGIVNRFEKNAFYIESHYARPQIEAVKKDNVYFVNEPRDQGDLWDRIQQSLNSGNPVYISSQALSDPYGLYSGPYLHNLTLSYRQDPVLMSLDGKKIKLVERFLISRADNLIIYEIIRSDFPLKYPNIPNMAGSQRRIDYYDPLRVVYSFVFYR